MNTQKEKTKLKDLGKRRWSDHTSLTKCLE